MSAHPTRVDPGFGMITNRPAETGGYPICISGSGGGLAGSGTLGANWPCSSTNWAGNYAEQGPYTDVQSGWLVPILTFPDTTHRYSEQWLGLGGSTAGYDGSKIANNVLLQIGTEADEYTVGGLSYPETFVFWNEVGNSANMTLTGVSTGPGNNMYASVTFNLDSPYAGYPAGYFIENVSNQTYTDFFSSIPTTGNTCDCNSADAIVERPIVSGNPTPPLSNWSGAIQFQGAMSVSSGGSVMTLGEDVHVDPHLVNDYTTFTECAYPDAWIDPGTYSTFNVYRDGTGC